MKRGGCAAAIVAALLLGWAAWLAMRALAALVWALVVMTIW